MVENEFTMLTNKVVFGSYETVNKEKEQNHSNRVWNQLPNHQKMVDSVLQLSSSLVLKLLQTFKIELNLQHLIIYYNLPLQIVL